MAINYLSKDTNVRKILCIGKFFVGNLIFSRYSQLT